MIQTLAQLRSGQLSGVTQLCLNEQLKEFPKEVFTLADSLQVLDLSHNQISRLPAEFSCLKNLRILFLSHNRFESVPEILAQCPALEMIGFKSNQITEFAEDALPLQTRWLILTDNKIMRLPDSIGKLQNLQKLALAGNEIQNIPAAMAQCKNLELVRLSANQLNEIPDAFLHLPKLSWLAVAGNAFNRESTELHSDIVSVPLSTIALADILGEGASGVIHKAQWLQQPPSLKGASKKIAVKIFKAEVTSDGYPADELANCLRAGEHKSLVKVIAQIQESESKGLVMELIPSDYRNLGMPPSLQTCTRDTFNQRKFTVADILTITSAMAETMVHLHKLHISHGDLYAHNIMVDDDANALLGDFGAASDISMLPAKQKKLIQAVEVRAFACLLDDLLSICRAPESFKIGAKLIILRDECMQEDVSARPDFKAISKRLKALSK